jgi:hypothetical protein
MRRYRDLLTMPWLRALRVFVRTMWQELRWRFTGRGKS